MASEPGVASAAGAPVEDLIMLPWTRARAALADRPLRLRLVAPPYPALGLGVLRLLRVRVLDGAHDGAFELAVGYDGYERL
ncbi:MAG: hypothetical protein ABSD03_08580 [Vulcanimicrobiaceae bacterium]|jgi:hypothetical protein